MVVRAPAVALADTPALVPDMFVFFADRVFLGNTDEHFTLAPKGRFRLLPTSPKCKGKTTRSREAAGNSGSCSPVSIFNA
jgi:hypothetical protein